MHPLINDLACEVRTVVRQNGRMAVLATPYTQPTWTRTDALSYAALLSYLLGLVSMVYGCVSLLNSAVQAWTDLLRGQRK